MSEALVAKRRDDLIVGVDPSVTKTVQRLGKISKYEPPKVVSFAIDGLRVTAPISLAGNT